MKLWCMPVRISHDVMLILDVASYMPSAAEADAAAAGFGGASSSDRRGWGADMSASLCGCGVEGGGL